MERRRRRLAVLCAHLRPTQLSASLCSGGGGGGGAAAAAAAAAEEEVSEEKGCVFCAIVRGESPAFKVYEDDVCLCILDSNPLSHGHSLIIPKCHFPSLEATPPPVPSKEQTNALSKELCSRSKVPDHVFKAINALPVAAHPMTQFANGVMALQVESEFQKAYDKGIPKAKFWEPTYDDCMNLVARLPVVASYVYRRIYKDGKVIPADDSLDYVTMKVVMLAHIQVIWLLVLSDPYLSFAAALNGLAGPLHGLANQEVLLWIKSVVEECGENITTEQLKDYVWKTLNSGKVVPGFGHGVLRKTDPRYTCQREFALKHLPDDPQIRICG